MTLSLNEKSKNRFLLLQKLYEIAEVKGSQEFISISELGSELGMDEVMWIATFEYLRNEGLAISMGMGWFGNITHQGIKEVEDALESKPTEHFPTNIVTLINSPGAYVVSGVGNQVSNASTIFDQRGQHVKYQYNAAGNINIGAMQNNYDLAAELENLEEEVGRARDAQVIDKLTASKVTTPLLEAAAEAKKPEPDRKSILSYLGDAKDCLKGVAAVGGIIEAITKTYEWYEKTH